MATIGANAERWLRRTTVGLVFLAGAFACKEREAEKATAPAKPAEAAPCEASGGMWDTTGSRCLCPSGYRVDTGSIPRCRSIEEQRSALQPSSVDQSTTSYQRCQQAIQNGSQAEWISSTGQTSTTTTTATNNQTSGYCRCRLADEDWNEAFGRCERRTTSTTTGQGTVVAEAVCSRALSRGESVRYQPSTSVCECLRAGELFNATTERCQVGTGTPTRYGSAECLADDQRYVEALRWDGNQCLCYQEPTYRYWDPRLGRCVRQPVDLTNLNGVTNYGNGTGTGTGTNGQVDPGLVICEQSGGTYQGNGRCNCGNARVLIYRDATQSFEYCERTGRSGDWIRNALDALNIFRRN